MLTSILIIFSGKHNANFFLKESNSANVKLKSQERNKKNKVEAPLRQVGYQNPSSSTFHGNNDFEKSVAFNRLASDNISEALRIASLENDVKKRSELYGIIACSWAKTDPDGCYQWAELLESPWDKQSALVNLLQATSSNHGAQKALELFDRIPQGNIKDAALVFAFMYIADSDTEGAIKRVDDLSGRSAVSAIATMLSEKFASDGNTSKIFETWNILKPGEFRDLFGSAMFDALSRRTPVLAKDWLNSISEDTLNDDGFNFLERQTAVKNADLGVAIASNSESTPGMDSSQSKFGHEWGLRDPASARNWLLEISSSGDYKKHEDMTNAVVEELVRWDQEAILKNIFGISNPETRNDLIIIAAKELSLVNPARGMELLFGCENPDTESNRYTVSKAMSVWMNKDPLAASEWVGLQNSGPLKDVAIKSLVENSLVRENNLDLASTWADSISDVRLRDAVIKQIHNAQNSK